MLSDITAMDNAKTLALPILIIINVKLKLY